MIASLIRVLRNTFTIEKIEGHIFHEFKSHSDQSKRGSNHVSEKSAFDSESNSAFHSKFSM